MTTITRRRPARLPAAEPPDTPPVQVSGILDVGDSKAFLRASGYEQGPNDISLSIAQVRQYGLRKGDHIEGAAQVPRPGRTRDKYAVLAHLDTVNGLEASLAKDRPDFGALTPLHP